jgi:hypothetical protein
LSTEYFAIINIYGSQAWVKDPVERISVLLELIGKLMKPLIAFRRAQRLKQGDMVAAIVLWTVNFISVYTASLGPLC